LFKWCLFRNEKRKQVSPFSQDKTWCWKRRFSSFFHLSKNFSDENNLTFFIWLQLYHLYIFSVQPFFFFFNLRGCSDQLARTTTNPTVHWIPCKPSGHVRHRGDDRHAHENSNPGAAGKDKPLPPPGQDPRCSVQPFFSSPLMQYLTLHYMESLI